MAPPSIAASWEVRDVAELTRGRVAEKERCSDRIGAASVDFRGWLTAF